MDKTDLAFNEMKEAHKNQKRWDGRPYHVHPIKVVNILERFGVKNENVICAAFLHDVLENTPYGEDKIKQNFGYNVLSLVKELTFNSTTDEEYINRCSNLSDEAKLIKIADILSNITDEGKKSDHFIRKRIEALKQMI